MAKRTAKLCSMQQAAQLVRDGDRVAFGGFAVYQKPMAMVHELIRAKKRDLTLVGSVNSIEADMLIGAGCVRAVETSYIGLEKFGLALNYRRMAEAGKLKIVHYPEMIAWDRFRANAEGLDFWPVSYLGGSDIVRLNPDIKTFANPMSGGTLYAVPAANPDVVIVHVVSSCQFGNAQTRARHLLPQSMDIAMSRSTRNLILTAETIISAEELQTISHLTSIPAFRTKAVVEAPFGAHPTPVLGVTGTDDAFFADYTEASKSRETFDAFLDKYVYGVRDHGEYLQLLGRERLDELARAKEGTA